MAVSVSTAVQPEHSAFPLGKETRRSFKQALHNHPRALGVTGSFKRNYNHPHLESGTWLPALSRGYNERVDNFSKLRSPSLKLAFQGAALMA